MARSYDAAGRLISEGLTTNGQTYTPQSGYDNANRRTSITYPNGQVISRAYSDRNQLSDIWYGAQIPSNRALTRTYTDAGRLFISNFGNNRTELRSYLTDGLTNAMVTPGVTNFTYGYDANKRKTQETNGITPNNSQTFNYDSQDRLTNWTRLSGDAQNWSLSLVGDWNSTTGSKNGSAFSETRTHNAVHELTAINSSPLGYDFKGNLTQDQTSKLYAWDQENRLKQAVIPAGLTDGSTAGTHTYQYDALGRRVAKVVAGAVTVFAHDGAQVICEYTGTLAPASPARVQVWGDYIDELIVHVNAGQKYYAHVNHLYSVEALTDNAGVVVERYRYDAYGAQKVYSGTGVARAVSLFGQKSGFTGRYSDTETQLWYFRARYHDSVIGRFVSRDPLGYVDGWSLYTSYFVPQNLDPWGYDDDVLDNTDRTDPAFGPINDPFANLSLKVERTIQDFFGGGTSRCALPQYDELFKRDGKRRKYNKYDQTIEDAVFAWASMLGQRQLDFECLCKIAKIIKAIAWKESQLGYGSGFKNKGRFPKQNPGWVDTEDAMQTANPQDGTISEKVKETSRVFKNKPLGDMNIPGDYDNKNVSGPQSIFYGVMWFFRKLALHGFPCKCDDESLKKAIRDYNGSATKETYRDDVWTIYTKGISDNRNLWK